MPTFLGRILCFFGLHDFQIIDATFGLAARSIQMPGSALLFTSAFTATSSVSASDSL